MKKNTTIAKLWYNGEIPARLFFEILETSNLTLLKKTEGKAKKGALSTNWAKIYDEYFLLKGDMKLANIINTQVEIAKLVRSIEVVRQALYAICTVQFDDDGVMEIITKIRKLGFEFDEKKLMDSVVSILNHQIPSLETRIEIEKDNLKSLTDSVAATFEDSCVALEGWGYKIDEDCSLRRYVAYEKAVKQKASKQNSDGKR